MKKLSMEELGRMSVENYRTTAKSPLILVLDNVRSMHNVGSAFRSADAFLVEKIFLCGITATPPHREIEKTALGATLSVEWVHMPDTHSAVQKLKEEGYMICAFEQADQSIKLHQFMPEKTKKYALVFGNEVFGVSDHVVSEADHVLEIPQLGTKHSFNISVTIGMALWDFSVKLDLFREE
jgi:23S rRNA (guanosine2251-2'-O)-methyltransferase